MTKNKKRNDKKRYDILHEIMLKDIKMCSWFGIILGFILTVVFGFYAFCSVGIAEIIFYILFLLGIVLILFGTFYPMALERLVNLFKTINGKILKVIMVPFFLIFSVLSLASRNKSKGLEKFEKWEKNDVYTVPCFEKYILTEYSHTHKSVLSVFSNVLCSFYVRGSYFLIPLIFILIVIGIIFFFSSTNILLSFLYTFF